MTGLLEFDPDEKEFVADYNAAWEIVARQLVMDKAQLRDIQQHLRPIFNQGITKMYKQLEPIFNRTAWQWPNLDKHIALFRTYPEMPYMLDWAAADVKVTKRSIPEARHRAEILLHYVCFLCRAQRRNRKLKPLFPVIQTGLPYSQMQATQANRPTTPTSTVLTTATIRHFSRVIALP